MLSKSQILNNLRGYNVDEIAEAINNGVVSMYELSKTGELTPLLRKQIQSAMERGKKDVDKVDISNSEVGRPKNVIYQDSRDADEDVFPSNIVISSDDNEMPTPVVVDDEAEPSQSTEVYFDITPKRMFQSPFSFKGRIRRKEYWISMLIYYVWYFFLLFSTSMTEQSEKNLPLLLLALLLTIPAIWFIIAQNTKRCHDRGNSGWWQLIPFYGLWLLFANSEEGANRYGECPK